ncbi:hypothetical protein, partial [Microbispora rosea]
HAGHHADHRVLVDVQVAHRPPSRAARQKPPIDAPVLSSRMASQTISGNSATASCASDERVTGGGFKTSSSRTVTGSYMSGNGWTVELTGNGGGNGSNGLVYAVCTKIS